jgi:hypothetical protein
MKNWTNGGARRTSCSSHRGQDDKTRANGVEARAGRLRENAPVAPSGNPASDGLRGVCRQSAGHSGSRECRESIVASL